MKTFVIILFFVLCGTGVAIKTFSVDDHNQGLSMTKKDEKPNIELYYDNMSYFHRNGEVFWIGSNGRTIAYKLSQTDSGSIIKEIFDFQFSPDQLIEIKNKFLKIKESELTINDRKGIPDEVRIRFGFRNSTNKLIHVDLWESDQKNQPKTTTETLNLIQVVSGQVFQTEPKITRSLNDGLLGERAKWPEEFKKPE